LDQEKQLEDLIFSVCPSIELMVVHFECAQTLADAVSAAGALVRRTGVDVEFVLPYGDVVPTEIAVLFPKGRHGRITFTAAGVPY